MEHAYNNFWWSGHGKRVHGQTIYEKLIIKVEIDDQNECQKKKAQRCKREAKINQSNFIYLPKIIQTALSHQPMIIELRKSCIDTIDRALLNLTQTRTQWGLAIPKLAQQKLHSVQNDLQLLKDNFTLIISKMLRLESRCNDKQAMALKVEHKYRGKFEQLSEAYKILEVKHQKLGKQLTFIKFSNNGLRAQIQNLENRKSLNQKLKKALLDIEKLMHSNSQNLQNRINKIISTVEKECQQGDLFGMGNKPEIFTTMTQNKNHNELQHERVRSISQFSLEGQVIKPELHLKEQNRNIMNSCELKTERQHIRTKKKTSKNKQSLEFRETASTEKKRSQLAKLVEQQSRLARINQRYLSTDIY